MNCREKMGDLDSYWEASLTLTRDEFVEITQAEERKVNGLLPTTTSLQRYQVKAYFDCIDGTGKQKQDTRKHKTAKKVQTLQETVTDPPIRAKRKRTQVTNKHITEKKLQVVSPTPTLQNQHQNNISRNKTPEPPIRAMSFNGKDNAVTQEKPVMPKNMKETIERIGGKSITWLHRKNVFKSDIDRGQNRWLFTVTREIEKILTDTEKICLMGDNNYELKVSVVDNLGEFPCLTFTYWGGAEKFVFRTEWMNFVERHGLKRPNLHELQIWSFRKEEEQGGEQKLCFERLVGAAS